MHCYYTNSHFLWKAKHMKIYFKKSKKKKSMSAGFSCNNYILKRPWWRREGSRRRFFFIQDLFHFRVWWTKACVLYCIAQAHVSSGWQFPWTVLMGLLNISWSSQAKEEQKGPMSFWGHISWFSKYITHS